MNMNDTPDWVTPGHMADIAADELAAALAATGIGVLHCDSNDDGVDLSFPDLAAAEALLSLVMGEYREPGSLYDRATTSCVSLSSLAARHGEDVPPELVADAIEAGWVWFIHPHMRGRVAGWHVSVTVPVVDANQLTATLNTLRHGGAL